MDNLPDNAVPPVSRQQSASLFDQILFRATLAQFVKISFPFIVFAVAILPRCQASFHCGLSFQGAQKLALLLDRFAKLFAPIPRFFSFVKANDATVLIGIFIVNGLRQILQ